MILELDTTLLDIFGEISINQLVFLTLVLNDNQSNNQDVHKFLSRISENDIQELIDNDLISFTTSGDNKIYSPTENYCQVQNKIKHGLMSSMKYFQCMF